jgi:hypothetical protein
MARQLILEAAQEHFQLGLSLPESRCTVLRRLPSSHTSPARSAARNFP